MKATHLVVLLTQLAFGLVLTVGGTWGLPFVVAAPLVAAVMPS